LPQDIGPTASRINEKVLLLWFNCFGIIFFRFMNIHKGLGVALVTPFNEDFSIDFEALGRLVEFNISQGANFLVLLGTTAETATLSPEERQAVIKHIVAVNQQRLPLVLGMGGNNTLALKAEIESTDLSPFSAILSVTPYYNKPNQAGLYAHYEAIASTQKAIILYNVPGRTGQNMTTETTLRLAKDFKNIIAIKEAGANINQYYDILRLKNPEFDLLSGDDEATLPVVLAGASGVISVIGQAFPKAFSQMMALGKNNQVAEAFAIHNQLVDITRLIFEEGNPAGIKALLSHMGLIKNVLRLPLVKASNTLQKQIAAAYDAVAL
jgi:4-hydroxy-tetrahydrodipicolinate synthase